MRCQSPGGHTKPASYRTFLSNTKLAGEREAIKIARLEYDCMIAVHEFVREHDIPCDAIRCDTVDITYDQRQSDRALESIDAMRKSMGMDDPAADYKTWDALETAEKFLCEGSVGSITYPAGSLSAYKLVIGILKLALKKGLNLQCDTPVTALRKLVNGEQGRGRWLVETTRGVTTANKVIMATNGYTAHLYPKFQGVIVPVRGHVTAQRPGRAMPKAGLKMTYAFFYKTGFEYMISPPARAENARDIVIGGGLSKAPNNGIREYGNTDDTTLNDVMVGYLNTTLPGYFGQNWGDDHAEGRTQAAWSGIMGYSADAMPFVGPIPGEDGLFIQASFQGHGMVFCFLCAKGLTQMLLSPDEETYDWFPKSFIMTEKRLEAKFKGKLHSPRPMGAKAMTDDVDEGRLPL
jgi:glycine/D-amino acid oxidase-like deaminating enzyme